MPVIIKTSYPAMAFGTTKLAHISNKCGSRITRDGIFNGQHCINIAGTASQVYKTKILLDTAVDVYYSWKEYKKLNYKYAKRRYISENTNAPIIFTQIKELVSISNNKFSCLLLD
jgi:hypothetical protein